MARFFRYPTIEAAEAGAASLGLSIRFSRSLEALFRPVAVGPRTVGNALCIHPMEGCDGSLDGNPGELTLRRYRRFGAGGAKLIWCEAAAVCPEGRANPRQLLVSEQTRAGLARLLAELRQAHREALGDDSGLVVGLQLTHSGRYSQPTPLALASPPPGPSGRVLTDEELERLPRLYARAARISQDVGFDFVDVKQCHGYLLNEALGARARPGRFGGGYEGRTRLGRMILEAIRHEAPGLLLATRLGVHDGAPPGRANAGGWGVSSTDGSPDLAEPLRWVGEMRELGVALVSVTMGCPYTTPHLLRPFEQPPPDGYDPPEHPLAGVARHFELTERVQRAFPDLAVVGSGYSWLQELFPHAGAANLEDGAASFVGLGRGALAQPDFARQLERNGRLDRKRVCRTFSYCTALMRCKDHEMGQMPTGCPPFDREAYGSFWEELRLKVGVKHGGRT